MRLDAERGGERERDGRDYMRKSRGRRGSGGRGEMRLDPERGGEREREREREETV